jgi:hypothetical protein
MDINKYLWFDLAMNYTRTQSENLPQGAYNAGNPLQSLLQWIGR